MKYKLLVVLLITLLFSCSRTAIPPLEDQVKPRTLQNFQDTTDLEHVNGAVFYTLKDSSLVYSRAKSFYNVTDKLDKTAVLANAAMPKTGGTFTNNTWVQSTQANKMLVSMNLGGTSSTANTTFGPTSYYLGLGHREYAANSYRLIGFGFRYTTNDHYPVVIGYKETNTGSSTYGDFSIWTRPSTSNVAATERLRVTAAGAVKSYGAIAVNEDVATKGYVDTAYMITKTITFTGTYSLNGTPSNTFVRNNANAANTITLPIAKDGIRYTIWKIGSSVMTLAGSITDAGKTGGKVVSGTEAGSTISVICAGNTWVIVSKTGTWTTQ